MAAKILARDVCPDCGAPLANVQGADVCADCGFSPP